MLNKIVTVIKREYTTRVKSKGFVVSLFLMPVLMCGLVLLSSFLAIMDHRTKEMRKLAVIDETGEVFTEMQAAIARHSIFQRKGELVYQLHEEGLLQRRRQKSHSGSASTQKISTPIWKSRRMFSQTERSVSMPEQRRTSRCKVRCTESFQTSFVASDLPRVVIPSVKSAASCAPLDSTLMLLRVARRKTVVLKLKVL